MNTPRLLLLAGAALVAAACADQTPTTARRFAPDTPRMASVDGACTGTFTLSFDPALTNQPDSITITGSNTYNCTLGASSGISAPASVTIFTSCLVNLLEAVPSTDEVVTWTGGTGPSTSTIRYTTMTVGAGVVTSQGTVTSGRFLGDAVVRAVVPTSSSGSNPLLCPLGLGNVTGSNGTVVLTITDTSV